MRKQTKGVIFTVLFGGGLMFWATAASLPGTGMPVQMTETGTPADNFADDQRAQFCGKGEPKTTRYIREYGIPTACTQPLAITTDPEGTVWFAQTNTGRIASLDPATGNVTEYDNPSWPGTSRSMMWGADYLPDGTIWYTDETHNSVWMFSTENKTYSREGLPASGRAAGGDPLPQRLAAVGDQVVINDLTGSRLIFLDQAPTNGSRQPYAEPSRVEGSVTSGFAEGPGGTLWYTNWIFQEGGVLAALDLGRHGAGASLESAQAIFHLPEGAATPNGVAVGQDGTVWLADTSSSYFFGFDPLGGEFTRYVTSPPPEPSYGNATGVIAAPISRPYWMEADGAGRIVFNEQTANSIGVFDPAAQSLAEYAIPSRNPAWADCGDLDDCGLAQAFDIAVDGDLVWFTEWAENNVGVLDTSAPLPVSVGAPAGASVGAGQAATFELTVEALEDVEGAEVVVASAGPAWLSARHAGGPLSLGAGESLAVEVEVEAGAGAAPGEHKVLAGVRAGDATVSRFVTVAVG